MHQKEIRVEINMMNTPWNEAYGYKIRIGDYRILVDIMYNPEIIVVRYIDTRGRVYKRI